MEAEEHFRAERKKDLPLPDARWSSGAVGHFGKISVEQSCFKHQLG